MDIDHHNPTLPSGLRNRYENLHLASRHCNGSKSDEWPDAELRAEGIHFIDPCKEGDYGYHIFEDPETFRLWGATNAGRYHIRMLDLNAPHLVRERQRRHFLRGLWKKRGIVTYKGRSSEMPEVLKGLRAMKNEIEKMIHDIPQRKAPSRSATKAAAGTTTA